MHKVLDNLPYWLLLPLPLLLPWALGTTGPMEIRIYIYWSYVATLLWIFSHLYKRRFPATPCGLWLFCLPLLAYGWLSALNAPYLFDYFNAVLVPLSHTIPWLPGAWDYFRSVAWMERTTALLLILLILADACRHAVWRTRFFASCALAGGSVAIFGLLQRALHAPSIFWLHEDMSYNFFATYRYHGNAGAFLNLAWPVLGYFFILGLHENARLRMIPLLSAFGMLACLLGLCVNFSRAATAIGLSLFAVWILVQSKILLPACRKCFSHPWAALLAGALAFAFLFIVLLPPNSGLLFQHWIGGPGSPFIIDPKRLAVYKVCWKMFLEHPWTGFGPGCFQTIFPAFTWGSGSLTAGVWRYAHQDYLQTLVEWGLPAGLLWMGLVAGALIRGFRQLKNVTVDFKQRQMIQCCLFSLAGILLHATVDFPLQIVSLQVYTVIFLGVLWALPNTET